MGYDIECPFCHRVAAGEYMVEASNDHAVVFAPLEPVTEGHLLVVSRLHVESAAHSSYITSRVMEWAVEVVAHMGDCNIITSIGEAATQTVRHLHLHLVPRTRNDGLKLPWTEQARA